MWGGLLALAAGCASAPGTSASAPTPVTPPAASYDVNDILGADKAAIDALLGAPALTRREGEGEFRRYTLNACELIVVLYPDETGVGRAAHLDTAARSSGVAKPDLNACLAAG